MKLNTADLCDKFGDSVQVLGSNFKSYGGKTKCYGEIATIKLNEDNSELISMLKEPGNNRIAVVDVHGLYCAVVGDNLMGFAEKNGWRGIVVNGYVRDINETKKIPVGLWALGTCPKKSAKKAEGQRDIKLNFDNTIFTPGNYLYADNDGIILSKNALHLG